jgi:hypothetical protein
MKISRRGTTADYGVSSVELSLPAFAWVKADSCLTIKQTKVKDFSSKAHHDYTIRLTVSELNEILVLLSNAAFADPVVFEKHFENSLKALAKLQFVAAGIRVP